MLTIDSPSEMQELGKKIGAKLKTGDVVALIGPLGAGKTELTKGIGAVFGITEITSPTFVIARSYKTNPTFIHMDAYRLMAGSNPLAELEDLDLNSESAITVIEWGDLASQISNEYLEIKIDRSDDVRKVEIIGHGPRWVGFSI
jgi:tRNA threonylcarbamoyladenosine biosynthesis protein TsaE